MDDFVFSLTRENEYYYKYIDKNRANIAFTYKKCSMFLKILKRVNCFFIKKSIFKKITKILNDFTCKRAYDSKVIAAIINSSGLAIMDSYLTEDLMFFIRKHDINKRVYLVIWNSLSRERIDLYKKYFDDTNIFSYSKKDCERYDLNYCNDFHLIDLKKYFKCDYIEYDLYFLGRDKNRTELLEDIITKTQNLNNKIQIYTSDKNKTSERIEYFCQYKSFDEYLRNVCCSKCLLDITSDNNISFRTIEALIFKKKLITNNEELKKYDFYNPENILLYSKDLSPNDINDFINKPYVEIDNEIIKEYDFYTIYDFFKKKAR